MQASHVNLHNSHSAECNITLSPDRHHSSCVFSMCRCVAPVNIVLWSTSGSLKRFTLHCGTEVALSYLLPLALRLKANHGMGNMMARGEMMCMCVGLRLASSWVQHFPLSQCLLLSYMPGRGNYFRVFFIHVFPLCLYLCVRLYSLCCKGFKCPSACPGTSVGWLLHKWNTAVD